MTPQVFLTLSGEVSAELEEKRSRFLSFARPVHSEPDARAFLEALRKEHPQARHIVYAYRLLEGDVSRMSDDGEPQGTGGAPLLQLLSRAQVTDVLLCVVRYFGGILLGAGPLCRAYGAAGKGALQKAEVQEMALCADYSVSLSYALLSRIQSELSRAGALLAPPAFAEDVTLSYQIPIGEEERVRALCRELLAGGEPKRLGEQYLPTFLFGRKEK